ncbi:MAG: hypothetical protein GXO32_05655 [Crenarchaeota archaeon]|nr:hypothetical protein [Thermoproteota archaeon]
MRSIAFLGRGGQGIVFAGEVIAETLFEQGLYVAQLQSYGAEVRGGSVLSYVVFDRDRVENPFIESFSLAIVLHEAGMRRWMKHLEGSDLVILDELVSAELRNAVKLPISRVCVEKGVLGRENVVAIGVIAASGVLDPSVVERVLSRKRGFEKNIEALKLGLELGRDVADRVAAVLRL